MISKNNKTFDSNKIIETTTNKLKEAIGDLFWDIWNDIDELMNEIEETDISKEEIYKKLEEISSNLI